MSFLKNLQKNIKAHHFIALIGILVLALAVMQYSGRKKNYSDGFDNGSQQGQMVPPQPQTQPQPQPGVVGTGTSPF